MFFGLVPSSKKKMACHGHVQAQCFSAYEHLVLFFQKNGVGSYVVPFPSHRRRVPDRVCFFFFNNMKIGKRVFSCGVYLANGVRSHDTHLTASLPLRPCSAQSLFRDFC